MIATVISSAGSRASTIDLKALEITELRILSSVSGGGNPGPESSIMKLSATRLEQEINELSVDVLGYTGFVMNPVARRQSGQGRLHQLGGAEVPQQSRRLHLWRLAGNTAQYHRQDGAGTLGESQCNGNNWLKKSKP